MADQTPLYTAAQLSEMLSGILHSTDNIERRAIEGAVVRSLATPANLVQLVNVLCNNTGGAGQAPTAGVRQLAAVLLRKKIFSLWRSLAHEQRLELRGLLLAQLGTEPARMVRFAIAHIVTRLAKADDAGDGGGWPELQQAIRAAAEDPRVEMRELSMVLIYSFAEVFSGENALSGLAAESVLRGLADADIVVRGAAVKAAAMLTPSLEANARLYAPFLRELVPLCLSTLTQFAVSHQHHNANKNANGNANRGDGDDDDDVIKAKAALCVAVLDLIEQLLADLSVKKNADIITHIVRTLLEVLGTRSVHARVRQNCGAALVALVSAKPKFIVSHNLLQPLVDCGLRLMAEDGTISLPDEAMMEGDDDDDNGNNNGDDDDLDMLNVQSACMVGAFLLSGLATSIASKPYTAAMLPFITAVTEGKPMSGVNVQDPLVRKAAMLALACLAEGNHSYLRRRVGFVLDVVRGYFNDATSPIARESAAFALSNFALRLQPEILTHHAELFPMLVPLLADANDLVRCRAAEALDTLCENVAEDLEPYIPTVLLPAVVGAISCGGSSLQSQKALCGVLSSMGMTRCPSFVAAAPAVLELLKQPFAVAPTPETLPLRAQATETVGIVAAGMGKDAFAPYFSLFMGHVVEENFALGSAALREQSFGFLANVCEVLGTDFMPFLDASIAAALHTVAEDTTVYTNKHLLATAEVPLALGDDMNNDDDNDDDGDDDAAEIHMRVRTADVEEKCSAVHCVGVFAETLLADGAFGVLRAEQCLSALSVLDGHYYPNVRSNMMLASAKLVKAAHGSVLVDKSTTADTLAEVPRDMLDDLIHQTLINAVHKDMDKEVVAAACEALQLLLDFFGPQCFPFGPDALVKECILFLRQKKACQLAIDFDHEDSDQDDIDGEDLLFREADDRIAANHNASWRDVVRPDMVLQGVELAEDHDEELLDSAMEMLESLAKAYGPSFDTYAPYLVPLLLVYCDATARDAGDLVMGSGTLAVLLESLGSPERMAPYFDAAVGAAFAILSNSDESTARGNGCYMLRVLVEGCPARFTSEDPTALQQTLQALWTVASVAANTNDGSNSAQQTANYGADEIPQAVDNAISATCSLVRCCSLITTTSSNGTAVVAPSPLLAMLPSVVPPLLRGIPMRLDRAENANAVRTLVFLLSEPACGAGAGAAWLPNLVRCAASVLAARTVEDGDKRSLISQGIAPFVAAAAGNADVWRAARLAAQLTAEQDAALQQAGF